MRRSPVAIHLPAGVTMKRDMELIRQLLMKIEESGRDDLRETDLQIDGYEPRSVMYHIELLEEADLIKAEILRSTSGTLGAVVERLTWDGHEFLAAARNETVWNRVMKTIRDHSVSLPFDVLKTVLVTGAKSLLEP